MKTFIILFANGSAINENTTIKRKDGSRRKITTPLEICNIIKSDWCKETSSKSFTDWANYLNEDENFEGTFTVEDALDNLCSNYHLNIDGKHVDLYKFFLEHKPFKVSVL